MLFVQIVKSGDTSNGLAIAVYAAGFFLLFGFSCAYNMTPPSPLKWLLRRFDHAAIYLMIAGTYTALLAQLPNHALAWTLAAHRLGRRPGRDRPETLLAGTVRQRLDRFLSRARLGGDLGRATPAGRRCPASTMALIAIGGLLYSVGVIFYRWHSLKFQNAIWHDSSWRPRAAIMPASRAIATGA